MASQEEWKVQSCPLCWAPVDCDQLHAHVNRCLNKQTQDRFQQPHPSNLQPGGVLSWNETKDKDALDLLAEQEAEERAMPTKTERVAAETKSDVTHNVRDMDCKTDASNARPSLLTFLRIPPSAPPLHDATPALMAMQDDHPSAPERGYTPKPHTTSTLERAGVDGRMQGSPLAKQNGSDPFEVTLAAVTRVLQATHHSDVWKDVLDELAHAHRLTTDFLRSEHFLELEVCFLFCAFAVILCQS
jgi:hypothetical protein